MYKVIAFCPASITLIFKVHRHSDPTQMGSTGVGFTIDKGVTATIATSEKTTVRFNGEKIFFPTVLSVIEELTHQPIYVNLHSTLPLGCGFGLSGASAIAVGHALNKLLQLKKPASELLEIAYKAEVVNKTGLGTVTTQSIGGFLLKETPGLEPIFTRLPFAGKKISAVIISKLETPGILKNKTKIATVNKAADKYLSDIKRLPNPSLEQIFGLAYSFAYVAGLIYDKKTKQLLQQLKKDNLPATVTMLGNVVLTTKRPTISKQYKIMQLTIT